MYIMNNFICGNSYKNYSDFIIRNIFNKLKKHMMRKSSISWSFSTLKIKDD